MKLKFSYSRLKRDMFVTKFSLVAHGVAFRRLQAD